MGKITSRSLVLSSSFRAGYWQVSGAGVKVNAQVGPFDGIIHDYCLGYGVNSPL